MSNENKKPKVILANLKDLKPTRDKLKQTELKNKKEQKKTTSEEKIVEALKNTKVDEIILAGGERKMSEKETQYFKENITSGNMKQEEFDKLEGKIQTFEQDLDSLTALYLLNELNKNKDIYNEGAKSTVINIRKGENKPTEKTKGLRVFIDVGGSWLKFEKDGETTSIRLDHHGEGQRSSTSGTKMMYEIMQKAGILKENPEWLKKFVNFVNDFDNLDYIKEKKFNEKYFKEEWPYTLYAIAEKIPFKILLELVKSGKIKNLKEPFSEEDLTGKFGKMKIGNSTIAELFENAYQEAKNTDDGIKNAKKLYNTPIGKIVYHDFNTWIKDKKTGKPKRNLISNNRGFIGATASGFESFAVWNKQNKSFFINSNHPNLSEIVKKLNEVDPECAKDVRGVMIFGKIKNLTEKKFLEIITGKEKPAKKVEQTKTKETEKERDEKENQEVWTEEDEKKLQDAMNSIDEIQKRMMERKTRMEQRAEEIKKLEESLKK